MISRFLTALTLIISIFFNQNAFAQGLALIRDAETEKFLSDLSRPIFLTAGLNPDNIRIYIINDDGINAFVSGGQNVFINTGLIQKYKTPDALIGVIAHETGHIAAGHLARSNEGSDDAQGAMMLSYLLGIGAILAGSPDAGTAMIIGGSQSAQRLYMKFTRTQEEAADQYAIKYLDKMKYPISGLVNLLEFFESEMRGYKDQIDEYLLSHPVSQKRIDVIKARTAGENFSDKKINEKLQKPMDRVLSKLEGFIETPDFVLSKYKDRTDVEANYVKSIAFFRKGKLDLALKLLDPIIATNPQDGFLLELKGQMLFESGRVQESILTYSHAIKLISPQYNGMAKIAFASSILKLKTSDKDLMKLAISSLEEAKQYERETPFLFKQLANSYSRIDDEGRSDLALAEYYLLTENKSKCRKLAAKAKKELDKNAKIELLRADDLIDLAHDEKEEAKEKEKEKEKGKEK
jgi:predicted Zn-dependent protease